MNAHSKQFPRTSCYDSPFFNLEENTNGMNGLLPLKAISDQGVSYAPSFHTASHVSPPYFCDWRLQNSSLHTICWWYLLTSHWKKSRFGPFYNDGSPNCSPQSHFLFYFQLLLLEISNPYNSGSHHLQKVKRFSVRKKTFFELESWSRHKTKDFKSSHSTQIMQSLILCTIGQNEVQLCSMRLIFRQAQRGLQPEGVEHRSIKMRRQHSD